MGKHSLLTNTTKTKIQYKGREAKRVPQNADYFERKLDDKRRLTIPPGLRNEFSDGYVLTRGFGNYLHLYPANIWEEEVEPALKGSIIDESIADLNVKFRLGKSEGEIDQKQGRITLEQHQAEYAGIEDSLQAVRVGKYWRLMNDS